MNSLWRPARGGVPEDGGAVGGRSVRRRLPAPVSVAVRRRVWPPAERTPPPLRPSPPPSVTHFASAGLPCPRRGDGEGGGVGWGDEGGRGRVDEGEGGRRKGVLTGVGGVEGLKRRTEGEGREGGTRGRVELRGGGRRGRGTQWHRTGYRWSPVRTLSVAPLWCDLGCCS